MLLDPSPQLLSSQPPSCSASNLTHSLEPVTAPSQQQADFNNTLIPSQSQQQLAMQNYSGSPRYHRAPEGELVCPPPGLGPQVPQGYTGVSSNTKMASPGYSPSAPTPSTLTAALHPSSSSYMPLGTPPVTHMGEGKSAPFSSTPSTPSCPSTPQTTFQQLGSPGPDTKPSPHTSVDSSVPGMAGFRDSLGSCSSNASRDGPLADANTPNSQVECHRAGSTSPSLSPLGEGAASSQMGSPRAGQQDIPVFSVGPLPQPETGMVHPCSSHQGAGPSGANMQEMPSSTMEERKRTRNTGIAEMKCGCPLRNICTK